LVEENPEGMNHIRVARETNGVFAVVYLAVGQPVTLRLTKISGEKIRAWWFNPRQNSSQLIGKMKKTTQRRFTPPTSGRNNDWVLVIEDASEELPRIGSSYQNIIPKVAE
jgi:hypothetical protein